MKYFLFTDGGSRGNPGPGGIGVVLKNSGHEIIYETSRYIGKCTNNEAEYTALYYGLKVAQEKNVSDLECFIDSELVVKQLNGAYKVKNHRLKAHFNKIDTLRKNFQSIKFIHVKRDKNKRADALVNEVLDNNGF